MNPDVQSPPMQTGVVTAGGHVSTPANALVIVPTYNERDNLPVLTSRIMDLPGFRVLVVDDASPDGTGEVADALAQQFQDRVMVLHRRGPRGLGHSYVDGFRRALQTDAEFICQMDGDLSHDPGYLPDLVLAASSEFDLVIGSRYVCGVSVVNWPMRRILLSTMANRYVRAVTRLRVRDCTGGFRCWRRTALERLPLTTTRSNGYAFMVETLYRAAQQDYRIGEVPIIFVERRAGTSKVSGRVLRESLTMPWRLVLEHLQARPAGHRRIVSWSRRPAAMREPERGTFRPAGPPAPRIDGGIVLRYR